MSRLPMPRPVPIIRGKIVTLRPLNPDGDAKDYYEMNLDPEMHLWTHNHVLDSQEEAREELGRFAAMNDVTTWAVVDNNSGTMIGRFFVCLEERDGELVAGEGNRIAKAYWRKGHNREARRLVFEYVFDVLQAECYETDCWAGNINSVESVKAQGFLPVEEIQDFNKKYNKCMKKARFRLSRTQWKRQKT